MVNNAFDTHQREYLEPKFSAIRRGLDLHKDVEQLKQQMREIRQALNLDSDRQVGMVNLPRKHRT
jgi:hypothetical protein